MRFNWIISFVLCIFQIFASESLFAQQEENELIIEQLAEELTEEFGDGYDYDELMERLNYYRKFPIDINKTQGEELKELRFLSPLQITALLSYRKKAGQFISTYELQSIKSFDLETVERLLPFIAIPKASAMDKLGVKNVFRKERHDIMMRYGTVFQRPEGYQRNENSERSRYLGSPDRYFIRYRYKEPDFFQLAVNMKKDPGEQFFSGKNNLGFDFYSASLYFHDLGKVKKLVVGDYSLQIGQGLSLWSGLSFGKGSLLQNAARQGLGLRPYTSSNEILFLRGIAGTYVHKSFEITPFVSFRKLDATLSDSAGTFSNLGASGYHRTQSEIRNKAAVDQLIYGLNLQYQNNGFQLGASVHRTAFGKYLVPNQRLYNRFSFAGNDLINANLYYQYTLKGFYLFGEVAHSFQSGFAIINGLINGISHDVSLVMLHRYYERDYYAFYNQGFAEGSEANNEKGFYVGLMWTPSRRMHWVGYADYFKFPWLKFRVDGPSQGYDLFSQFVYAPTKKTKFLLRYRFRKKQENSVLNHSVHLLEDVHRHQVRLEVRYAWLKDIGFRNRFEISRYKKGAESDEMGWMFYQDIIYKAMGKAFSGNARIALFNTASYNSRIYAFENDVLYGYSFPAYSTKGMRFYGNLRYRLSRKADVWIRYATFLYDKKVIGTGLDKINGRLKSSIRLQFRFQF